MSLSLLTQGSRASVLEAMVFCMDKSDWVPPGGGRGRQGIIWVTPEASISVLMGFG